MRLLGEMIDTEDIVLLGKASILLCLAVIALLVLATAIGLAVLIFEGVSGGVG